MVETVGQQVAAIEVAIEIAIMCAKRTVQQRPAKSSLRGHFRCPYV